jgi:hypothetical protein
MSDMLDDRLFLLHYLLFMKVKVHSFLFKKEIVNKKTFVESYYELMDILNKVHPNDKSKISMVTSPPSFKPPVAQAKDGSLASKTTPLTKTKKGSTTNLPKEGTMTNATKEEDSTTKHHQESSPNKDTSKLQPPTSSSQEIETPSQLTSIDLNPLLLKIYAIDDIDTLYKSLIYEKHALIDLLLYSIVNGLKYTNLKKLKFEFKFQGTIENYNSEECLKGLICISCINHNKIVDFEKISELKDLFLDLRRTLHQYYEDKTFYDTLEKHYKRLHKKQRDLKNKAQKQ